MKSYKIIVFAVVLAIVALLVLPFLLPTQTYIQKAERVASEKLGVPVTIVHADLRFLPSPRLVADNIVIGDDQNVKVEKLVIVPTLSSLFSGTEQVNLKVIKPVVKKSALSIISALKVKNLKNLKPRRLMLARLRLLKCSLFGLICSCRY
ncbi:MAG: hypothetical protein V4605_05055 [Pseudomonadota bacterium]